MGKLTARYPPDCRSIILQSNGAQQLASEMYLFFLTCPYTHYYVVIMPKCRTVCFARFFFPLVSCWYLGTYHGRVAVCAVSFFLLKR